MTWRLEPRSLWSLDPSKRFLNHGSYGACPRRVLSLQQALRDEMERAPTPFMASLPERLQAARLPLARFLGASESNLAWVTNATTGVNAVLRSRRWAAGDEILVTNHGYPACRHAVSFLEQRLGVRAVTVPFAFPPEPTDVWMERLQQAVSRRTRLLLIDHVTSPTALILPIDRIAQAMKALGVEVLVDGAHAPGMLDLQLDLLGASGVTYYTGNLHKWCCAPKGSAFLWVAPERQPDIHPTVISHGFDGSGPGSRFHQEFDWCGTFDPSAWLAAPRALELLSELHSEGWSGLRADCGALLRTGRDRLAPHLPPQPLVPDAWLGQMVSLQLGELDGQALASHLWQQHGMDTMVTRWEGRWLFRLSAAPYTTLSEITALAETLGELLRSPHRWS